MSGSLAHRPLLRLLRFAAAVMLVMTLSGLSHAAEELVENVVHVADTGHGAHADTHPEGETGPGTEHFCFGTMHNCGCCPAAFAAATGSTQLPFHATHRLHLGVGSDDVDSDGIRSRIDRPPRA